jgi:hypothetical protein
MFKMRLIINIFYFQLNTFHSLIRWEFVLDFDSRSDGMLSSLVQAVKSEGGFWDPKVLNTKELKELMSDGDGLKFRENIDFGKRTTWVKANVKDPPISTWINSCRGPLSNLLLQVTSSRAVGDSRYR